MIYCGLIHLDGIDSTKTIVYHQCTLSQIYYTAFYFA